MLDGCNNINHGGGYKCGYYDGDNRDGNEDINNGG